MSELPCCDRFLKDLQPYLCAPLKSPLEFKEEELDPLICPRNLFGPFTEKMTIFGVLNALTERSRRDVNESIYDRNWTLRAAP